jgi:cytochrome P450
VSRPPLRTRVHTRVMAHMFLGDLCRRGVANECFAKQLLEQQAAGKLEISDLEVAWACGTPFGAGVETTSGTLLCFLLACAEFGHRFIPQAQAELDKVVGSDRLPTFDDEEDLPFIRAIVKETLRWRPIAVLGVSYSRLSASTGGLVLTRSPYVVHREPLMR